VLYIARSTFHSRPNFCDQLFRLSQRLALVWFQETTPECNRIRFGTWNSKLSEVSLYDPLKQSRLAYLFLPTSLRSSGVVTIALTGGFIFHCTIARSARKSNTKTNTGA
jgi:hypothetical protein